ncbi:hypothetical protein D9M68_238320 [compost metagenome]
MPMPPHPFTLTCTTCNWKKTVIPLSDALVLGRDWFKQCPQCRHAELTQRPATQTEILRTRLEQFLHLDHS